MYVTLLVFMSGSHDACIPYLCALVCAPLATATREAAVSRQPCMYGSSAGETPWATSSRSGCRGSGAAWVHLGRAIRRLIGLAFAFELHGPSSGSTAILVALHAGSQGYELRALQSICCTTPDGS